MSKLIRELILEARKRLKKVGIIDPEPDVSYLAAKALKIEKKRLALFWYEPATEDFCNLFYDYVSRREKREPLQYILEEWGFWELSLKMQPGVLIPRPESEELFIALMRFMNKKYADLPLKIIEPCTGSGALGLSVAKDIANSFVCMSDISDVAVESAKTNMQKAGVKNALVVRADSLSFVADESVDVVVCNPPYIPTGDLKNLMPEVGLYEPHLALDGGCDGLVYINRLISESYRILVNGGTLAFEHGDGQREQISQFLDDKWKVEEAGNDLCLRERYFICSKRE